MNSSIIPVYLFTGLLESGKTTFINKVLKDRQFNNGELTLLIVCEDGQEKYCECNKNMDNVKIIYIENKEYVNRHYLEIINNKENFERVLIEYNGMWELETLYSNLPLNWAVFQQMLFIDSSTFLFYNKMFRNQLVEKIKDCESCVFNRYINQDKELMHKTIRMFSKKSLIYYEDIFHNMIKDDLKDSLPFDENADVIQLSLKDYAIWYQDISYDFKKYKDKKISTDGKIVKIFDKSKAYFGRMVMVCCEADIKFLGMGIKLTSNGQNIEINSWYKINATIECNSDFSFLTEVPFELWVYEIEKIEKPDQNDEVATFF